MTLQKDNPGAVTLGDAITLKLDGATVVAALAIPTGDAIDLMKADAARKAKKQAEKE